MSGMVHVQFLHVCIALLSCVCFLLVGFMSVVVLLYHLFLCSSSSVWLVESLIHHAIMLLVESLIHHLIHSYFLVHVHVHVQLCVLVLLLFFLVIIFASRQRAFAVPVGQISEPFLTERQGWHVLKVLDRNDALGI